MSLAALFYLIAIVLAVVAAFGVSARVNLLALAVAFIAAGLVTGILT